jgi:hypothetical protein
MNTGIPNGGGSSHGSEADVEHPLSNQDRPGRGTDLIHDRDVGLRIRPELPIVKAIAIVPNPVPCAHVRSGDEPIKPHRDFG